MSLWNMFSAGDTIEKGTDALISAGDKLFYTDEEKADMKLKATEWQIKLLEAYHPFKVTQRILAIWYSFLFGFAFLTGIGIAIANIFIKFYFVPTELIAKPTLLDLNPLIEVVTTFGLFGIVITIVAFYFAGGSIESFKTTFMSKK